MAHVDQQAFTHARIAARQGVMKGLDRDSLARALVREAARLAFGVSEEDAAHLAACWEAHAFRVLAADYVGHTGGEPRPVRLLRPASRRELFASTTLKTAAR